MTVLLCRDLETLGQGIDLAALAVRLRERYRVIDVRVVDGPCARPECWLDHERRPIVLGLCSAPGDRSEFDGHARRRGLEPLAIEIVDLATAAALAHARPAATDKAVALLAARLARARACRDSGPEHLKPFLAWDQQRSRRTLFALPLLQYEVVPWIRQEACLAGRGCRTCVTLCPREALRFSAVGQVTLSKTSCTGCGACVAACPGCAIDFPGASPAQINAEIEALMGATSSWSETRAILFLCERARPALDRLVRNGGTYPFGCLPVEVPCLGMITPTWILECLRRGAAAVGVLGCDADDCRFGRRETIDGRVGYCNALVARLGGSDAAVRLMCANDGRRLVRDLVALAAHAMPARDRGPRPSRDTASIDMAAAQAILGLAARYGAPADGTALDHPHSPLGVVTLDEGCTSCGSCAAACPTAALRLGPNGEDADGVSVSFDARLCIACDGCVRVCPESVVHVERRTDLARLTEGRRVLHRDREFRCERCGAPTATRALLMRLERILGRTPVIETAAKLCGPCRSA